MATHGGEHQRTQWFVVKADALIDISAASEHVRLAYYTL